MFTLGVFIIFLNFELSKFMTLMCRVAADGGIEDFDPFFSYAGYYDSL